MHGIQYVIDDLQVRGAGVGDGCEAGHVDLDRVGGEGVGGWKEVHTRALNMAGACHIRKEVHTRALITRRVVRACAWVSVKGWREAEQVRSLASELRGTRGNSALYVARGVTSVHAIQKPPCSAHG